MYALNFIACILCASLAAWNVTEDKIILAIVEALLFLGNLPFAIKWLKTFI
jgi:hypothetical protein